MFDANNIVEIRKKYKSIIGVLATVYYEDAPAEDAEGVTYPFVVFDIPDSDADGESTEVFDFYINGWDDNSDTTVIEKLMYDINQVIDGQSYPIDGTSLSFRAVLDNKRNNNDADLRLKRKEYRYSIRSIQRRS